MKKYKLIGVTKYAEQHLTKEDLDSIKEMIGCTIEECNETYSAHKLFMMPDGVETHIDFLKLEEVL